MKNKKILIMFLVLLLIFTAVFSFSSAYAENNDNSPEIINGTENVTGPEISNGTANDADMSLNFTRFIVNTKQDVSKFNIIGQYNDTYLMQYDSTEEAINAYSQLQDKAVFITPDYSFSISGNRNPEQIEMSVDDNPLICLTSQIKADNDTLDSARKQAKENGENPNDLSFPEFQIALIDSGVSSDKDIFNVSMVSDFTDKTKDTHGDQIYKNIKDIDSEISVLSISAINSDGIGSVSSIYASVQYAIERKVDYINISFLKESGFTEDIKEIITSDATEKGIKIIDVTNDEDKEKLNKNEFTKILVNTDENISNNNIVSSYENTYLLQFDNPEVAEKEYKKLSKNANFITPDYSFSISNNIESENSLNDEKLDEENNPLTTLQEQIESDNEILDDAKKQAEEQGLDPDSLSFPHFDVALIDTGVTEDCDAFAVSVLPDGTYYDGHGHGTDMYNIIKGTNENASILSIKALDDEGKGSVSSVYAAIQYAIERKVDIINLSISACANFDNDAFDKIVDQAADEGIIVVGAAGNDGSDAKDYVPGSIRRAIIVGACDKDGNIQSFSNYGDTVDFYIVADSTSEATARMSGYLSFESINKAMEENDVYYVEGVPEIDEYDENNNKVEITDSYGNVVFVEKTDLSNDELNDESKWEKADLDTIDLGDDSISINDDKDVVADAVYKDDNLYFHVANTTGNVTASSTPFNKVNTNITSSMTNTVLIKSAITYANMTLSGVTKKSGNPVIEKGTGKLLVKSGDSIADVNGLVLTSASGWRNKTDSANNTNNIKNSTTSLRDLEYTITFKNAAWGKDTHKFYDVRIDVCIDHIQGFTAFNKSGSHANEPNENLSQPSNYPPILYVTNDHVIKIPYNVGIGMKASYSVNIVGGESRKFALKFEDIDAQGFCLRGTDGNYDTTNPVTDSTTGTTQVSHQYEPNSSHSYSAYCETVAFDKDISGIVKTLYAVDRVSAQYSSSTENVYVYHGSGQNCSFKVLSDGNYNWIDYRLAGSNCLTELFTVPESVTYNQKVLISYQNADGTYPAYTTLVNENKAPGSSVNYNSTVTTNMTNNNTTGIYNTAGAIVTRTSAPDYTGSNYTWTVAYDNTVYIQVPRKTVTALVRVRYQKADGTYDSYTNLINGTYRSGQSISWNCASTTTTKEGTHAGQIYNTSGVSNYSGSQTLGTTNVSISIDVPRKQYTYKFDENYPSGVTTGNAQADITKYAENTSGSVSTPTATGYTFKGWHLKNSTTPYQSEAMYSNKEFVGEWEKNPPHALVRVRYQNVDGSWDNYYSNLINDTYTTGTTISWDCSATTSTKEGTHAGQIFNTTGVANYTGSHTMTDQDYVLNIDVPRKQYTYKFDENYPENTTTGNAQDDITKYAAANSGTVNIPTAVGYTFKGWHLKNSTTGYQNEQMYSNKEFVGEWEKNKYHILVDITFQNKDGVLPDTPDAVLVDKNADYQEIVSWDGTDVAIDKVKEEMGLTTATIDTVNIVYQHDTNYYNKFASFREMTDRDFTLHLLIYRKSYKYTFDENYPANTTTGNAQADISKLAGNESGSVKTPTAKGYTFKGWHLKNATTPYQSESMYSNKDFVGEWERNKHHALVRVRYQNMDGTYPNTYTNLVDKDVYEYESFSWDCTSTTATKEGTHAGQIYNTANVTNYSGTREMQTQDITISIDVPRKQYTYTFDENYPTVPANLQTGNPQDDITKLAENESGAVKTPTARGYTFKGWHLKNATTLYKSEAMYSNKDFVGEWERNKHHALVRVRYQNMDGSYPSTYTNLVDKDVYEYESFSWDCTSTTASKEGTHAGQIYNTANVTNYSGTREMQTSDITISIDVPRKQYTYTFDENYPTVPANLQTGNPQDDITKLAENVSGAVKTPTARGYTFKGWYLKNSTTSYQSEAMYSNKDFVGEWDRNHHHALVRVRYQHKDGTYANDYTNIIDTEIYEYETFSWDCKDTTRAKEGEYVGLIYNTVNVSDYSGTREMQTQDITISIDVPRKIYTYDFDGNKPSNATNDVNNIPNAITKLAENTPGNVGNASLKGWTFLGWNTDKNATSGNYNPNEVMLSNKTFYALWRPNKYYIKYDPNKDQEPNIDGDYEYHTVTGTMADQTMYFDTTANLTANAYARKGYKWLSWNTKADGTGTTYTDKQSVINLTDHDEGVITLYAQWEKLKSSSTLTVISEETGNPIRGVEVKLQKKLNGNWVDVSTQTTDQNGFVRDERLDWFDYRYIPVKIPAGYEPWKEDSLTFKVDQDNLPRHDLMTVLLMKRVDITVKSTVNDIIKGEDGPAIAYIVEGTDVAGVKHRYTLMNQIDVESLKGSDTTAKIFAGTYDITAIPVSRYYLISKTDRENVVENGDVETADVIENKHAEITYNYEMKQYEGFSSVDSVVNHIED